MDLTNQLRKHLPFEVKIRREIIKQLKKEGKKIEREATLNVVDIYDTMDFGGIVCVIPYKNEALVLSLTHLTIDNTHPMAEEIKKYQYERIIQLRKEGY